MSKRKRMSYDVAFKLKVISFAEEKSNCAAEREFGVSEKMVRDWRMKKEKLSKTPKTVKKMRLGLSPYDDMEKELHSWIVEQRKNGYIVTMPTIRLRARQLAKETRFGYTDFKGSNGWCSNFMKRWDLCVRQRTHIAQKLPSDVENKVDSFHSFVINERKKLDYDLSQIGNMDETPMFFDMPGNRTVDFKGNTTVSVKTAGGEKAHFTVILSCMADGTKLKPAVVFKRKTMPKEKLPCELLVMVQEKGWVDESILMEWLEKVWFRRPGALLNPDSLLVWDMFRVHLLDSVKRKLQDKKTRQAVIPGGTTSILQPLDVCLNKPFKSNMRELWNDWMLNGEKTLTKAGNLKRPDLGTVCSWVVKAWDKIPADMVIRSFLKCGISNSMDGTQDDELYSDSIRSDSVSSSSVDDSVVQDEVDIDTGIYDEGLTEEQFHEMFGHSDDEEEFEGF